MTSPARIPPLPHAMAVIPLVLSFVAAHAQTQPESNRIPSAHGRTLSGTTIALPQSLHGKPAVLIIGFSHASQGQVGDWGKRLAQEDGTSQKIAFYEMPMLGGAPSLIRGMIIKSMGKSVPEAQKPHFLPITEDDKPWKSAAHISKPDDAYVLLVDGNGKIVWRTQGDESDTTYIELRRHFAELEQQGAHE